MISGTSPVRDISSVLTISVGENQVNSNTKNTSSAYYGQSPQNESLRMLNGRLKQKNKLKLSQQMR